MLTTSKYKTFLCGITLLLSAGGAMADYYEGKMSYGDGLFATASWADPATTISWVVTDEDASAPDGFGWKYTYVLSVPKKDISHVILEASNGEDPFTEANLADVTGTKAVEVNLFTPGKSNPSMPEDLYGVKFDDLSDTDIVLTFYSDRAPVWGDIYLKGGKDKKQDVLLYNEGFEKADPVALPSSGSLDGHLLRPDTSGSVPEPSLLVLLGLGGLGLLKRRGM